MTLKQSGNPHVPITIGGITDQVLEAAVLGITVVHLHALNKNEESHVVVVPEAVSSSSVQIGDGAVPGIG